MAETSTDQRLADLERLEKHRAVLLDTLSFIAETSTDPESRRMALETLSDLSGAPSRDSRKDATS